MRILLPLFTTLLISCSSTPKPERDEFVTVRTALEQAQMSYLKGCVDSFRKLGMAPSFDRCKEMAITHRLEINSILETPAGHRD